MKIRYRLALQFSLIVASILLIFSISIYWFSASRRTAEFDKRLKNRAISISKLLTDVKEVDSMLLEKINRNTVNFLYNENILIYDYDKNNLLYKYNKDTLSQNTFAHDLNEIKQKKEIRFKIGIKDAVGFLYPQESPSHIVIVSAINERGVYELSNLRQILIIGYLSSILITIFVSIFYATQALKPISNIINQVNKISASKLYKRVFEGKGNDEIATLSKTFNKMLDRLQESFEMQQSFVSNVSHELRTPLTSINGQIEVAFLNKRTAQEYEQILYSIHGDIINLITLANGFLELAESSMDNATPKFQKFRIDELLYQVKDEMHKRNTNYKFEINFNESIDDENKLIINGNSYLLKILFVNLIDNACKFSKDEKVNINLHSVNSFIEIDFTDHGIGIPNEDLENIMKPFYRGTNTENIHGHGIGLAIVEKIVKLHDGIFSIKSEFNQGTQVTIKLPYLS